MALPAISLQQRRPTLPVSIGAGLGIGLTAAFSALAPLLAVGGLAIAYLLLAFPEAGLLAALVFRPMLDLFNHGLHIPGFGKPLDPSSLLALMLIGAGGFYVVRRRLNVLVVPLVLPFGALLLTATVSILASSNPGVTITAITQLAGQAAIYILTYFVVQRRRQVERISGALIAAALLPLFWGFAQIVAGHGKYLTPKLSAGITHARLAGPFGEGLTVGTFLVIPLVLTFVLLLESRRRYHRFAYGGLLMLLLASFYLTLARGPWIAFAVALGVLAVGRYRPLLLLAPVAIALSFLLVPGISQRLVPAVESPQSTTAAGRLARWEGAWNVYVQHPILGAGFGVGNLEAGQEASGRSSPAHDDYLRVLADCGIPGLLAYLWLILGTGYYAFRTYRRATTERYRVLALAFFAVWAAFMVLRVSGNILTLQIIQYYFWSFAALVLALPVVEKNELALSEAGWRKANGSLEH